MRIRKDGMPDGRSSTERLNKYPVTDELIAFLKEHYETTTDKQLLALLHQREEWQWVSFAALRHIKYRYGIIKQHQVPFTEEEKQFVRDNYLTMGDVDMAKMLPNHSYKSVHKLRRITLGLRRDKASLRKIQEIGAKRGADARTRKLREGALYNPNYRKVGEVYRINCNNYWYIKPDDTPFARTILYHRWLWEKEVGPIPAGYNVRFRTDVPDDYRDITIDMLECLNDTDNAKAISKKLSDSYVVGRFQYKKIGIDKKLIPYQLIELKRNELMLKRELNNQLNNNKNGK